MKRKYIYILLFIGTIVLGLLSRKITIIPVITGDLLYAMMAYWLFRILITKQNANLVLTCSILYCFSIEFLQLIQAAPFVWIRNHPFLRLIFGQGFLWSDLLAYTFGATIAYFLDTKIIRKQ